MADMASNALSQFDAVTPRPPIAAVQSPASRRVPRLLHLQILRAVAASLVVVDHSFGVLNSQGYALSRFTQPGYLTGYIGVAAFFILSGLIMVRVADGMFGSWRSAIVFLWHRVIRIVPMYWLATGLWFLSFWRSRSAIPHSGAQLLLSLAFIPNYFAINNRMQPVLGQGWTLNYEMAFYVLFAICLMLPRKYAILALTGALLAVIAAGVGHRIVIGSAPGNLASFYTNPVIMLFGFGALMSSLENRLGNTARRRFPFSPALLLIIPPILLFFPLHAMTLASTRIWISFAALAVVVLCTVTESDLKSPASRVLVLLGDASYSTYLFHQWAILWMVPICARVFGWFHATLNSPAAFVLVAIVASNLLGLFIHLLVERPLTRALRHIKFGPIRKLQPSQA